MSIPQRASLTQLRTEFTLLIKTLNVLESLQGPGSEDIVISFFDELKKLISTFPPLSLSAYWTQQQRKDGACLVFKLQEEHSAISQPYRISNQKSHDPLNIVKFLFDKAKGTLTVNTLTELQRSRLFDLLLSIAVKSGRAMLLLEVICLTLLDGQGSFDISSEAVVDILDFIQDRLAEPALPSGNKVPMPPLSLSVPIEPSEDKRFLMTFGKADHGKLGHGDAQIQRVLPTLVESLKEVNIIRVASMSTYSLAVDTNGNTFLWGTGGSAGSNQGHRLDLAPQILEAIPPKLRITGISCGLGHTLFLTDMGQIYSWGNGGNGRLGLGDTVDRAEATVIKHFNTTSISSGAGVPKATMDQPPVIISVQCGACHSLALTSEGCVYIWGKNSQGQCGLGHSDDCLKPSIVTALLAEVVVQIAAGWEHTVARTTTGALYSWGSGYKDSRRGLVPPVLGIGSNEPRSFPELLSSLQGIFIQSIACGWDHCLALDDKGACFSWGSGQNGKLGHGNDDTSAVPMLIASLESTSIRSISAGCEHSAAISNDGKLFTWGQGDGGRLGHGDCMSSNVPKEVVAVAGSSSFKCRDVYCCDKFTMLIVSMSTELTAPLSSQAAPAANTNIDDYEGAYINQLHETFDYKIASLKNRSKSMCVTGSEGVTISSEKKKDVDITSEKLNNLTLDTKPNISSSSSSLLSRSETGSLLLSLMTRAIEANTSFGLDSKQTEALNYAKEYTCESSSSVFSCVYNLIQRISGAISGTLHTDCKSPDELDESVESLEAFDLSKVESSSQLADKQRLHGLLLLVLKLLRHNLEEVGSMVNRPLFPDTTTTTTSSAPESEKKTALGSNGVVGPNSARQSSDLDGHLIEANAVITHQRGEEEDSRLETSLDGGITDLTDHTLAAVLDARETTMQFEADEFTRVRSSSVAAIDAAIPGHRRQVDSRGTADVPADESALSLSISFNHFENDLIDQTADGESDSILDTSLFSELELSASFTSADDGNVRSVLGLHANLQSSPSQQRIIAADYNNISDDHLDTSFDASENGDTRNVNIGGNREEEEGFDENDCDLFTPYSANLVDADYDDAPLLNAGLDNTDYISDEENEFDLCFDFKESNETEFCKDIQQAIIESIKEGDAHTIPSWSQNFNFANCISSDHTLLQTFGSIKSILCETAKDCYSSKSFGIESFLIWKEINLSLTSGLSIFYESHTYMDLFLSLVKAPDSNIHIMSGALEGLLANIKSNPSDFIFVDIYLSPGRSTSLYELESPMLNIEQVVTFFSFVLRLVSILMTYDSEPHHEEVQYRKTAHIKVSIAAFAISNNLFTALVSALLEINSEACINVDYSRLDKLLDLVACTVLTSITLYQASSMKSSADSIMLYFLSPIITTLSKVYKSKINPVCSLIFAPFLKNIFLAICSLCSSFPSLTIPSDILRRLVELISVGSIVIGRAGLANYQVGSPVDVVDLTLIASRNSMQFKYRKLFDIRRYFEEIFCSAYLGDPIILDPTYIALLHQIHWEHECGDYGGDSTRDDAVNLSHDLALRYIRPPFIDALLKLGQEASIDPRAALVFSVLTIHLKLPQELVDTEDDQSIGVLLTAFYAIFRCLIGPKCCNITQHGENNDSTIAIELWLISFEVLAVLWCLVPSTASHSDEILYMTEIGKRIKSVSSIGVASFLREKSDFSRDPSMLIERLITSFTITKNKVMYMLTNPTGNANLMSNLRIGSLRPSSFDLFSPTDVVDYSFDSTQDTTALLICFLVSSVPIEPIIHSIVFDYIGAQAIAIFMQTMEYMLVVLSKNNLEMFDLILEIISGIIVDITSCERSQSFTTTHRICRLTYALAGEMVDASAKAAVEPLDAAMTRIIIDLSLLKSNSACKQATSILTMLRYCLLLVDEYTCVDSHLLSSLKTPSECLKIVLVLYLDNFYVDPSFDIKWNGNLSEQPSSYLHSLRYVFENVDTICKILTTERNIEMITSGNIDHDGLSLFSLSFYAHPTFTTLLKDSVFFIKALCRAQEEIVSRNLPVLTTFLYSGVRNLHLSSPLIIPNAFSVRGDYSLGIWIFIPVKDSLESAGLLGKDVHILSRVQESGDYNLMSLIETKNIDAIAQQQPCLCNPTIRLQISLDGIVRILVYASAQSGMLSLTSDDVPCGRWLFCQVGLNTTISSHSQIIPKSDIGELNLQISNIDKVGLGSENRLITSKSCEGRIPRMSPHQNVIIGQVSATLVSSLSSPLRHKYCGIVISDVTWNSNKYALDVSLSDIKCPPSVLSELCKDTIHSACVTIDFFSLLLGSSKIIDPEYISTLSAVVELAINVITFAKEEEQVKCFKFLCQLCHHENAPEDLCHSLTQTLRTFFYEIVSPNIDVLACLQHFSKGHLLDIWKLRIVCQRAGVVQILNVSKWTGVFESLNENFILASIASVTSIRPTKDTHKNEESISFGESICKYYCGGGWPTSLYTGSIIDLPAKIPFYWTSHLKLIDQPAFLITGDVISSVGKFSVARTALSAIGQCQDIRDGYLACGCKLSTSTILTPSKFKRAIVLPTELASLQDSMSFSDFSTLLSLDESIDLEDSDSNEKTVPSIFPQFEIILSLLRDIVAFNSSELDLESGTVNPSLRSGTQLAGIKLLCLNSLSLCQATMQLRMLLVQLQRAESSSITELEKIMNALSLNLSTLLTLAAKDPVSTVSSVFEIGSAKGVQLDVLKNLLKEDDVPLLEKLSLRIWKQLNLNKPNWSSPTSLCINKRLSLSPLAGEVSIMDNKVKAVSHFPSVKLNDVSLQRMSGRWFYEVILLTDGLMQIGWADSHFRCDPSCGQGVGDHLHSWAYDGLRTKRWSVSCEAYGKKWKTGDVIGVLVDMDLLEMSYLLNGESLGPAFVGFHATGLFPAISLNIRQCLRINFGLARFIYPPDEVDGYAFRPVCDGTSTHPSTTSVVNLSNSELPEKHFSDSKFNEDDIYPNLLTVSGDGNASVEGEVLEDSKLNESVELTRRFDDGTGPSAMTPIRGLDVRAEASSRRHYDDIEEEEDDGESDCGGSEDEGDDDEDEDEDDDEVSHEDNRWASELQEEATNESHQTELRRQVLVENLIGMGFPIDWALRAAENCDASISESTAIAWIIERMELEQAKLEGYSANSSRHGDDEDFGTSNTESASNTNNNSNNSNSFTSTAASIRDRLHRIESHDIRHVLEEKEHDSENIEMFDAMPKSDGNGTDETKVDTSISTNGFDISASAAGGSRRYDASNIASDLTRSLLLEDASGSSAWNEEALPPSVLFDRDSVRRRCDQDKQEVLTQITELDALEMCPIIASCQLALCILYSRKLVLKFLHLSLASTKLLKQNDVNNSVSRLVLSGPAELIIDAIKISFRQTAQSVSHISRISSFSFLTRVTDAGGLGGKELTHTPLVSPFSTPREIEFIRLLAKFEQYFFPTSIGSIAVEDPTDIAIETASLFIKALFSPFNTAQVAVEESKAISSTFKQLEEQTLRGIGVCLNQPITYRERERLAVLLVEDALNTLENAGSRIIADRSDWMSANRSRDDVNDTNTARRPYIFWAYFLLRTVLTTSKDGIFTDYFNVISPRLPIVLMICCRSHNASLRYCAHDLLTLFSVTYDEINHRETEQYGLDVLVREKKLLVEFSERVRSELLSSSSRHMVSRYTWRLLLLLRRWKAISKPEAEINYTRQDLISDWNYTTSASNSGDSGWSSANSTSNQITAIKISSTSVTVSWLLSAQHRELSQPLPSTGNILTIRAVSNYNSSHYSSLIPNIDFYGLHRLDNLMPGTLYEITITSDVSSTQHSTASSSTIVVPPAAEEVVNDSNSNGPVSSTNSIVYPRFNPLYVTTDPVENMFLDAERLPPNLKLSNGGLTVRNAASKKWSTVRSTTRFNSGVNTWDVRIDRCVSKNIFIGVVTETAKMDNYVGCDRRGWAFLANKAVWHNKSKLKAYGELFRTGDIVSVMLDLDIGTLSFSLNGKSLGVAADGLSVAIHGEFYPAFSLYNDDDQLSILPPRSTSEFALSSHYLWSSTSAERLLDRIDVLSSMVLLTKGRRERCMFKLPHDETRELYQRHILWLTGSGGIRSILVSGDVVSILVSAAACSRMTSRMAVVADKLVPGNTLEWEGAGRLCQLLGYASNKLWLQWLVSGEVFGITEDALRQAVGRGVLDTVSGPAAVPFSILQSEIPSFLDFENIVNSPDTVWSIDDDLKLVQWIEGVSQECLVHPLLLPRSTLLKHRHRLYIEPKPEIVIETRISTLLMMNDLFQVLLPLLTPATLNSNPEEDSHDLGYLLGSAKGLVFTQIKIEYASKYGSFFSPVTPSIIIPAADSNPTSTSIPAAVSGDIKGVGAEVETGDTNKSTSSSPPYPPNISPCIEFLIENEDSILTAIVLKTEPGARHLLFADNRWRLLAGLQSSVASQFMSHLERRVDIDPAAGSVLESALRTMRFSRVGWFPGQKGQSKETVERAISICIRMPIKVPDDLIEIDLVNKYHFQAFIAIAAQQTQGLLESLMKDDLNHLTASEINLVLTYMQAAGVICGLALNNMIDFPFSPPLPFLQVLVGYEDKHVSDQVDINFTNLLVPLLKLLAHAFRRGLISIFPETALMMFTADEFVSNFL